MAVSKRLRYEVLRRDNHTCRYCGAAAPDVKLTVDHVVPQALGGSDEPSNLVTACEACNSGKTSVPADAPIVASVADDALRWAEAMKKAAEMAHADHQARLDYREAFRAAWDDWSYGPDHDKKPLPLPDGWAGSLDSMREAGLPDWELSEAVTAAMSAQKVTPANTFRYFCGICWKKVRALQAQAQDLVQSSVSATRDVDVAADEIAREWLVAYKQRCTEKDVPYKDEWDASSLERISNLAAPLLRQGYAYDRVMKAAQKAGSRFNMAIQDFLGGLGDLEFDAMAAWLGKWVEVDVDSPLYKSDVPAPDAWQDFRATFSKAVASGLADEVILKACVKAGEDQWPLSCFLGPDAIIRVSADK
ncbi:HNH endonuclease [Streptomyces chilikensis]|uniref:HNH endonuclease n=1 Tax=Streptomyces chilikensis TaxID=1194079 RepID=A0ABV3ERH8_9ACTN